MTHRRAIALALLIGISTFATAVQAQSERVVHVVRTPFQEAPIRIYVHENADGTTTISYRAPSAVFAPYPHPEVRAVAAALDPIFRAIVDEALVVGSASPGSGSQTRP
jgi:hypothetical protein